MGRVPAVGKAAIVQRLLGESAYAQWGGGGTAPADGDTGLESAHPESRVAITVSRVTGPVPNTTNDTLQGVVLIQASAARDVREVTWWDALTGGTLRMRDTHGLTTLDSATEGIQYTLQIQFTAEDVA